MSFADRVRPGGPWHTAWMAAHWERKLKKEDYAEARLSHLLADVLLEVGRGVSLRHLGHLLLGSCRIFQRHYDAFDQQAQDTSSKLLMTFGKGALNDAAEEQQEQPALTLLAKMAQHRPRLLPAMSRGGRAAEEVLKRGKRHVARLEDITLKPDEETPSAAAASIAGNDAVEDAFGALTAHDRESALEALRVTGAFGAPGTPLPLDWELPHDGPEPCALALLDKPLEEPHAKRMRLTRKMQELQLEVEEQQAEELKAEVPPAEEEPEEPHAKRMRLTRKMKEHAEELQAEVPLAEEEMQNALAPVVADDIQEPAAPDLQFPELDQQLQRQDRELDQIMGPPDASCPATQLDASCSDTLVDATCPQPSADVLETLPDPEAAQDAMPVDDDAAQPAYPADHLDWGLADAAEPFPLVPLDPRQSSGEAVVAVPLPPGSLPMSPSSGLRSPPAVHGQAVAAAAAAPPAREAPDSPKRGKRLIFDKFINCAKATQYITRVPTNPPATIHFPFRGAHMQSFRSTFTDMLPTLAQQVAPTKRQTELIPLQDSMPLGSAVAEPLPASASMPPPPPPLQQSGPPLASEARASSSAAAIAVAVPAAEASVALEGSGSASSSTSKPQPAKEDEELPAGTAASTQRLSTGSSLGGGGSGGLIAAESSSALSVPFRSVSSVSLAQFPSFSSETQLVQRAPTSMGGVLAGETVGEESEADNASVRLGYSARTEKMLCFLAKEFQSAGASGDLSYHAMCRNKSAGMREQIAGCFFELLVLKTNGVIQVKQEQPYADIAISKAGVWAGENQ